MNRMVKGMTLVVVASMIALPAWQSAAAPDNAATTQAAKEPFKVTLVEITENRAKSLQEDNSMGMSMDQLALRLKVTGRDVAKARNSGQLEITQAVDDQGTDLVQRDGFAAERGKEMQLIQRWGQQNPSDGFTMDIQLKAAPRSAAKLAKVTGSFMVLVGGTEKKVVIKNAQSRIGEEIAEPALKAAGITVKIVKTDKESAGPEAQKVLSYKLTGKTDAIIKTSLVDASGKEMDTGSSGYSGDGNERTYVIQPQGDLPPDAGLQFTVLHGAKLVKVPVDLKDIPLP